MSDTVPTQIACLIWDVDGTLTDTTALIVEALDHIYRTHYGRSLPTEGLRALIGTPLREQIRVFGEPEQFGVTSAQVMDDFIRHYEQNKFRERILEPVIALLVEGKRRGLPTALVTSKNREELNNTLPRLQIADCIDLAVTADDVKLPKPDSEGLLKVLSAFGTTAASAVFIGDTVHDMRAARSAGVPGIAVTWGAAPRALLELESPALVCDTPDQLEAALFKSNRAEKPSERDIDDRRADRSTAVVKN